MRQLILVIWLLLYGSIILAPPVPPAGTLDTTFNSTGTNAGFMNLSTELAATNISGGTNFPAPSIAKVLLQTLTGAYFIAADYINMEGGGPQTIVTKMSVDDIQQSFGNSGAEVVGGTNVAAMLFGQTNIAYGEHEVFFVVGGSGDSLSHAGWIHRINQDDGYNNPQFDATDVLDGNFAIAQQTTGRLIVAGIENGFGTLIAYDPVTGAVDTTFANNGRFSTTYTSQINSVIVDSQDNIYMIANDNTTNYMAVLKLTSNAVANSNYDSEIIWNFSYSNAVIVSNNYLTFDTSNNIIAATVRVDGPLVIIQINPTTGLETNGIVAGSFSTLTSIIFDESNRPVITGYNATGSGTPDTPYIARILANYSGFDNSFGTDGYVTITIPGSDPTQSSWYDAMINANGKIMVCGYGDISTVNTPYLMRVYGDEFVGQYNAPVQAGTPGTLNPNFGTDGYLSLSYIDPLAFPVTVLSLVNGSQYVAFQHPSDYYSFIAKFTNGNILDTNYGPLSNGISATLTYDVTFMMMDGLERLLTITEGDSSYYLLIRCVTGNSGEIDQSFGESGYVHMNNAIVTTIIQQTSARYVVSGQDTNTNDGLLWAFTDSGVIDTTFNSTGTVEVGGTTPGVFDIGVQVPVYAMVSDQYDRIIIAYLDGPEVSLMRLTASGELDTSFSGQYGCPPGIIPNVIPGNDANQICVALDANNNIVVVANSTSGINVGSYQNTTGVQPVAFSFGNIVSGLISPVLTNLVTTSDGLILISGNQSGLNDMWVARVYNNSGTYRLDTTFAPAPAAIPGIMQFSFDQAGTVTARNLAPIAMYGDGEIAMVGYETDSGVTTSFMSRAYDTPFTAQELSCLDSKPQGTNDQTFGVTTNDVNGIAFYGSQNVDSSWSQRAKAVAMQDDNTIIVALDGQTSGSEQDQIFINIFDVDGLLDTTFNPNATTPFAPGQALVLNVFSGGQYINDMIAYTTPGGISKIILAGLAYNLTLNITGSLLIQYDITNVRLDQTFGGFNGNSAGVAFGDSKQLSSVGLQSSGRIITSGSNLLHQGLVLGYNPAGNLDQGFGQGGTFVQGTTGIYAQTIDTSDNILVAYNDGTGYVALARILSDGSSLDSTFGDYVSGSSGPQTGVITTDISYRIGIISEDNNIRVAMKTDGTIVLAAVINNGTAIVINTWNQNGLEIIASNTISTLSLTSFTITSLLVDQTGKVIVVGYDYSGGVGKIVVLRTQNESLELDTTFNAYDPIKNPNGTPGYIKYEIDGDNNQATYKALIHPDGRIIIPGSQINTEPC